ncbi:MAG TPA: hypothetical protein DEF18_15795 [Muricauda sp.]|nr:hypothetical protein [Allomuricauda sp.]HBU79560.1 hypothetical protein [Allomuricauda sp.]|tara:strand:+ start:132 stop:320 length:189 start_codon:yes stop_codon:yes gene_type:complete
MINHWFGETIGFYFFALAYSKKILTQKVEINPCVSIKAAMGMFLCSLYRYVDQMGQQSFFLR